MSSKGDPSIGPTVVAGIIGTAVTIVLVILLHSYYGYTLRGEVARKVIAQPSIAVDQVRSEQLRQITEYRWVDQKTKVVAIPIDRAMELVLERGLPARAAADAGGNTASSTNDSSDAHAASDAYASDAIPRDSNSGRPPVPR